MIKMLSQNGDVVYGVNEYVADTIEELDAIKHKCSMGSKAYVISTNENYILSGSNEWVPMLTKYDDTELRELIQNNSDRITALTDLSPEDLDTFLEVANALKGLSDKIDNIDSMTETEVQTLISDSISPIEDSELDQLFGGETE